MKVLVCDSPGQLRYSQREMPAPQSGESLVRIRKVGICGTDLHAFEGVQPFFQYPRVLGHELAAEYIDGDSAGFRKGDRVSILPYLNCGACIACRNGKPNCCTNMKVCGVHRDGGMAEYFVVPSDKLIRGGSLADDELALVEPMAIGTHALKRANLRHSEFVLVIGAGPIGLGIMEVAVLMGARVIAMDINDARLRFCETNPSVAHTINPSKENAKEKLMEVTAGDMPTLVLDATGSLRAINDGFNYIAHGGRYVLVGLQKGEITFSHPEFHKREGTLMSSRNATKDDFDYVIQNIEAKKIDVTKFITHRITFERVGETFPSLLDPSAGVIKAIIDMAE